MMSKRKGNIEFDQSIDENDRFLSFRDFINGNLLTKKIVLKQIRYFILLVMIAFISIANRNHAEKVVIHLNQLQKDVKELRSHSITISAELIKVSRQSEVVRLVNRYGLGLQESLEPPNKLFIDER
ncbi:MAG: hypothetical protein JXR52_12885 [Bacteroidales bacterium]|nr:hypothetical protein [Bacteroidales bacterium]MBN2699714.1 hypothetical protein [Bacteroidales bacterium]